MREDYKTLSHQLFADMYKRLSRTNFNNHTLKWPAQKGVEEKWLNTFQLQTICCPSQRAKFCASFKIQLLYIITRNDLFDSCLCCLQIFCCHAGIACRTKMLFALREANYINFVQSDRSRLPKVQTVKSLQANLNGLVLQVVSFPCNLQRKVNN